VKILEEKLRKAEKMAVVDALTGLHNRRGFEEELEQQCAQALRSSLPLSVAVFDLDHFKSVNDTYGHDVGDVVLKKLAEILHCKAPRTLRQSDYSARVGGEEFAIILPGTHKAGAMLLIERLRSIVEMELRIALPDKEVQVTASFGVAEMGMHEKPGQLLKRADNALYSAKRTGRNRVSSTTSFGELTA